MKVLAFGASNHSASINVALATFAAERFKANYAPEAVLETINLNDYEMPIYSLDRENAGGIPQLGQDLYAKIGTADRLIISFPEYNGSYTSAWKNVYDWMSRIDAKVYQDTPAVALAATPGPRAGAGILGTVVATAPFFGMDLRASLGIGTWGEAFDASAGGLTKPDDLAALDEALSKLV